MAGVEAVVRGRDMDKARERDTTKDRVRVLISCRDRDKGLVIHRDKDNAFHQDHDHIVHALSADRQGALSVYVPDLPEGSSSKTASKLLLSL
ncbi:hypothetical protein Sjap_026174 [Stephania japonica]|uniref:Uncharacterized protein n=1 Tax=Stephania japonica TaxID=461633 RepID=A0AAP0EAX0_9MAGN